MAENTFIWIAVFAVLAAVINGIGILAIYKNKKWAEKLKTYLMCFAAGGLISTPLILALPKAIEKNFFDKKVDMEYNGRDLFLIDEG